MKPTGRAFLALSLCLLVAGCEPADRTATITNDDDQRQRVDALIDAYADMWNQGDTAALDTLVASDFRRHIGDTTISGRDGLAQNVQMNHQAFSNLNVRLHERVIDGDMAAVRFQLTGTNDGAFAGAPATNERMDVWGISLIRVSDNEIQEEWTALDQTVMLGQLGLMTPPQMGPPERPMVEDDEDETVY